MKKFLLILFALTCTMCTYAQSGNEKKDSLGIMSAEQVKVTKGNKRKDAVDAGLRAKAKELTRDLIENGRLQFEPEYAKYHGYYRNMNNEKYTKTMTNVISEMGQVNGWHADGFGGDFAGKPNIQIYNDHFYSNLEVTFQSSTNNSTGKRTTVSSHGTLGTESATSSEVSRDSEPEWTPATEYSSEELLVTPVLFNTDKYQITNFDNVNEYITTFDVIVNQPFKVENTTYDKITFQCAINILDARMAVRMIVGEDRICATYHGDMNYVRGNSF